ncbi:ABC transporter permease [Leucobacter sp. USHLN154]|uniref:ABC transporter permease n=1 Tax=Leucobacter sp. USHLN154 TaxID=3081269 RepID=UPI00301A9053
MTGYVIRRGLLLIASFAIAMVLIFVLLRLLPGDPANALLSVNATPEQIAAARAQVGSDQPILVQFGAWVAQMLRLDLGESLITGASVGDEISARLAVTLPLTVFAFALAVVGSLLAGVTAAVRADRWYGVVLSGVAQLGIAVPVFWVGIILVWVFGLLLGWFPTGGFPIDDWNDPAGAVSSLALPAIAIACVMGASLTRYVRSATLDVLGSDYLRLARAHGSGFGEALWRHGLRNGSVPVISVLGIELASTLLGAVVVESVFALPGLGSYLVDGISRHDFSAIQGVLVVTTLLVLLVGFVADVAQRIVDPRLRRTVGVGA